MLSGNEDVVLQCYFTPFSTILYGSKCYVEIYPHKDRFHIYSNDDTTRSYDMSSWGEGTCSSVHYPLYGIVETF